MQLFLTQQIFFTKIKKPLQSGFLCYTKSMKMPEFIIKTINKLIQEGYEGFLVGGGVRDLLMASTAKEVKDQRKLPEDWDITTNARPEEILKIFPDSVYNNDFGTVLVKIKNKQGETDKVLEVTTYRSEQGYSDRRHPDKIKFEDSLDKDLERRDFTINAMALGQTKDQECSAKKAKELEKYNIPKSWQLIDLFGGLKDIDKKIIRAVGEPIDRFKEDALRMMRAVRFAVQLGFAMEPKTERAIIKMAGSIKFIAKERIRDELIKILKSPRPYEGILFLEQLKLLQYIIPELLSGKGVKQNHHHVYSVWKHGLLALKHTPSNDWRVRFASLMHDVAKPQTRRIVKGSATFYNHEYAGERITRKIMKRLRFSAKDTDRVASLVRNHMFYYNTDEVTAASVRRLIKKVGKDNLKDLIDLRIADRLGSGTPKAKPYKLRHLEYMFERVQNDPVSVKMLEINGDYMIEKMGFKTGPEMGAILDVLLSEVIENPELNSLGLLEKRANELRDDNLETLRKKAKEKIKAKKEIDDKKMKKGYFVK